MDKQILIGGENCGVHELSSFIQRDEICLETFIKSWKQISRDLNISEFHIHPISAVVKPKLPDIPDIGRFLHLLMETFEENCVTFAEFLSKLELNGNVDLAGKLSDALDNSKLKRKHSGRYIPKAERKRSISFGVNSPVADFTGRVTELEQLHNYICLENTKVTVITQTSKINSRFVSLSGLGGMGKTQLAKKYMAEYSLNFDNNVACFNAENFETVSKDFRDFAKGKLKIQTLDVNGKEINIEIVVKECYKYFSDSKFLFVFDNVEDDTFIDKFLPHSKSSDMQKILITSRLRVWDKANILCVPVLPKEDAAAYVRKRLDKAETEEKDEIEKLIERLQCFPLALTQAVSYIKIRRRRRRGNYSILSYIAELSKTEEATKSLFDEKVKEVANHDYSYTTYQTWQVTISKIAEDEDLGKIALKFLNLISYFHADNVPYKLFENMKNYSFDHVQDAIGLLCEYSMIEGDSKEFVSVHRLVQEVTRINLKDKNKTIEVLQEALFLLQGRVDATTTVHAASVWNFAADFKNLVETFSKFPAEVVSVLDELFKFQEATSYSTLVEKAFEKHSLAGNINVLTFGHVVGQMLKNSGVYNEAIRYLNKTNELVKAHCGEKCLLSLNIEDTIAWCYYSNGELASCSNLASEVYLKRKEVQEENHIDTMATLQCFAEAERKIGNFKGFLDIQNKALSAYKSKFGEGHFKVLETESNISYITGESFGFFEESTAMGLKIYEKACHSTDPKIFKLIWTVLYSLGIGYCRNKEYVKAEETFMRLYNMQKESLSEDHVDTLKTYNFVGWSLWGQEKYEQGFAINDQVYKKFLKLRGFDKNSLDVLEVRAIRALNMSFLGQHKEQRKEAISELEFVLRKYGEDMRPDSIDYLEQKIALVVVLQNDDRLEYALKICKEVEEICNVENKYNSHHWLYKGSLNLRKTIELKMKNDTHKHFSIVWKKSSVKEAQIGTKISGSGEKENRKKLTRSNRITTRNVFVKRDLNS